MPKLDSSVHSRMRVINAIRQRCAGVNGNQKISKRVFTQVQGMHQVILGLEKLTGMPSTGTVLERYKIIVVDFQERVGRYQSKNPFQRLVHHRKMMSEFERIQGIVTALLQMLSMEMAAEIEDLKQQWKADRCAVNDHLASLLEDASASLLELQDVRDALLLLQNSSAKPVDITMYFDDLQRVGKGSSGTMASESSLGRDNEE